MAKRTHIERTVAQKTKTKKTYTEDEVYSILKCFTKIYLLMLREKFDLKPHIRNKK